jgi:hypothetical protein
MMKMAGTKAGDVLTVPEGKMATLPSRRSVANAPSSVYGVAASCMRRASP